MMGIPIEDISITEVCFTHVYEGKGTTLAVERLLADPEVQKLEIIPTPVEEEFAKWAMEHRGIEQPRLDRLTSLHLTADPVTYCEWDGPDGQNTHLLVDGNHRYVKAAMLGIHNLPGRIVPRRLWHKYVVTGIPSEVQHYFVEGPSGL